MASKTQAREFKKKIKWNEDKIKLTTELKSKLDVANK